MQALGLSMELLSDEDGGLDLDEPLAHPPLGDVLSDEIDDADIAAIVAELQAPAIEPVDIVESSEPEVWDDSEPENQNA